LTDFREIQSERHMNSELTILTDLLDFLINNTNMVDVQNYEMEAVLLDVCFWNFTRWWVFEKDTDFIKMLLGKWKMITEQLQRNILVLW